MVRVWRIVVEDSQIRFESFLLIVCTGWIFTAHIYERVPPDTQMFQHIAKYAPCWPRSETNLKATAPVKLPTRHGPRTSTYPRLKS
jgi:hypothetical protein